MEIPTLICLETLREENRILYMYPLVVYGDRKLWKCVFLTACTKKFLGFAMHTLGINKKSEMLAGKLAEKIGKSKDTKLRATGQHSMHREPLSYINQSIYV